MTQTPVIVFAWPCEKKKTPRCALVLVNCYCPSTTLPSRNYSYDRLQLLFIAALLILAVSMYTAFNWAIRGHHAGRGERGRTCIKHFQNGHIAKVLRCTACVTHCEIAGIAKVRRDAISDPKYSNVALGSIAQLRSGEQGFYGKCCDIIFSINHHRVGL